MAGGDEDALNKARALINAERQAHFLPPVESEPVLVGGVLYLPFLINALVCVGMFILTENFMALLVLWPMGHLIGFFYSRRKISQNKIPVQTEKL